MTTEKEVCSGRTYDRAAWYTCQNPVTRHEEGKPWCTRHAPSYVEAKYQKANDKWLAERRAIAVRDALAALRRRQADLFPAMVATLKYVINEVPWDQFPDASQDVQAEVSAILAQCEALEKEEPL